MKALRTLFVLSLALVFAGTAPAQEKKKSSTPPSLKPEKGGDNAQDEKAPAGAPSEADMAKMMETWKQAATPGEFHAKLKPLAGTWDVTTKARMSPDQPWEDSSGKAEYRWILGGRVLLQEIKANPGGSMDQMMGYPFEGFGMSGYDNVTKQYWGVWADNMGTGLMTSTGSVDGSGKTFTYTHTYEDPIAGKKTGKSALKIQGDDKMVFEMYENGPDGKEFTSLEVTYTRKK